MNQSIAEYRIKFQRDKYQSLKAAYNSARTKVEKANYALAETKLYTQQSRKTTFSYMEGIKKTWIY